MYVVLLMLIGILVLFMFLKKQDDDKKAVANKKVVSTSSSNSGSEIELTVSLDVYDEASRSKAEENITKLEDYLILNLTDDTETAIYEAVDKLQTAIDDYDDKQFDNVEAIPAITLDSIPVTIHYRDSKGNITNRTVIVKEFDGLYMSGYCDKSKGYRTFRADRIIDAADGNTGELINDLNTFFEKIYDGSPASKLDELYSDHYDLLRVLIYVVKADGQYTAKEKVVVRYLLRSVVNDDAIDDKQIDKMMSYVDTPTLHSFKIAVGKIANSEQKESYALVKTIEDIIATQKTAHPNEQFALDYIKQRFK